MFIIEYTDMYVKKAHLCLMHKSHVTIVSIYSEKSPARPMLLYSTNHWLQF